MARSLMALRHTALCRKLLAKLRQDLWLKECLDRKDKDYALFGLCPGYNQKAAGAWSWQLYERDSRMQSGWRPLPLGGDEPASIREL
jgi:hypothetical protein